MEGREGPDLEALERELSELALARPKGLDLRAVERARRRALRRPALELAWTAGLIVAMLATWATGGRPWLLGLAAGLALAILPKRVRALREQPAALTERPSHELLEVLDKELSRRLAGHFVGALLGLLMALVFGLGALIGPNPAASAGALAFALALVAWRVVSFLRAPRPFLEVADDDDDDDDDEPEAAS